MNRFECKPCDKVFNGQSPYNDHLASQKHKKKVNSVICTAVDAFKHDSKSGELDEYIKKIGNEFKCFACNVSMNDISTALSHSKGLRHLKTISQSKKNPTDSGIIADSKIPLISSDLEYGSLLLHSMLSFKMLCLEDVMKDFKVFKVGDSIEF